MTEDIVPENFFSMTIEITTYERWWGGEKVTTITAPAPKIETILKWIFGDKDVPSAIRTTLEWLVRQNIEKTEAFIKNTAGVNAKQVQNLLEDETLIAMDNATSVNVIIKNARKTIRKTEPDNQLGEVLAAGLAVHLIECCHEDSKNPILKTKEFFGGALEALLIEHRVNHMPR